MRVSRPPDQVRGNYTAGNPHYPAHDRRAAGQLESRRVWSSTPWPHRPFRQEVIDLPRRAPQPGKSRGVYNSIRQAMAAAVADGLKTDSCAVTTSLKMSGQAER
ncbi:MAG: hypothetical protein P8173_15885, partial [Gammaproteobacteria bacterium]